MENKNSHKAIFMLDNIAIKLYNMIVKQINALQSTKRTLKTSFGLMVERVQYCEWGNGQQDFVEYYNAA